jgi:hypothetical protein
LREFRLAYQQAQAYAAIASGLFKSAREELSNLTGQQQSRREALAQLDQLFRRDGFLIQTFERVLQLAERESDRFGLLRFTDERGKHRHLEGIVLRVQIAELKV